MTEKDKRPDTAQLVSSFDDPSTMESAFVGDNTIPGSYSSLSGMDGGGYDSGLAQLIDPALDGDEFAERTQTDLMIPPIEADAQETQKQLSGLIMDCLETLDDVDRLIRTARQLDVDAKLIVDIEMTRKRFLDRLGAHEVEHRPATGKQLDPSLHEVIREVTVEEAAEDGVVVETELEGYLQHGHALRKARVVVGRKS